MLINHALDNNDMGVSAGAYSDQVAKHLSFFIAVQRQLPSTVELFRTEARTKISYAQLRSVLGQTTFYATYDPNNHIAYQNFNTTLKSAVLQCAVKQTFHKYNIPVRPWMTSKILGVLKEKR